MNKPKLIMMVGIPYSGKSHLVKTLGLDKDYIIISSDNIILQMAIKENKSYNEIFTERVKEAQHIAVQTMLDAFKENKNVLIDQTNLTKASRSRKLKLVPSSYEKVCIVVPQPSDHELAIRKQERETHRVPDKVLENMQSIYQAPEISEGFDVIYYAGFDDVILSKDS